jgi:MOSC N-terminal beta barrel domain
MAVQAAYTSNMAVAAIYRYPVKGLSAERMDRLTLMPGECLPHDRRFAIALGSTHFDPESPEWLSKTHFIMLMRDEKLAQLQTRFDTESGVLGIAEDGRVLLRARLTEAEGCKRIAEFFENFLGGTLNGPLRVVEAPRHAFAAPPSFALPQGVVRPPSGRHTVHTAPIGHQPGPIDPLCPQCADRQAPHRCSNPLFRSSLGD